MNNIKETTLISVIVTTYNRESLLKETLQSILKQTYSNLEVIIVDNFSNYDFISFIKNFNDNRIVGFQNDNGGIIAVNRNYGLIKSSGRVVAFCDDDDLWVPDKIEKQYERLKLTNVNSKGVLLYSDVLKFKTLNKLEVTNRKKVSNINDLILKNQIPYSSVMVSNISNFKFDEDKLLVASEDYELWLKMANEQFEIVFIEEPLVYYRLNPNSAYHSTQSLVHIRNIYTIIKFMLSNSISFKTLFLINFRIVKELVKYTIKKIFYKY